MFIRYRVFYFVVEASLAFSLRSNAISPALASRLMKELSAAGRHHDMPESATVYCIIDFDRAVEEFNPSLMEDLSKEFREKVVIDD
jgi:hypothetical protein